MTGDGRPTKKVITSSMREKMAAMAAAAGEGRIFTLARRDRRERAKESTPTGDFTTASGVFAVVNIN